MGDTSQREPIIKEGVIDEEYLGVQFRPCSVTLNPGETAQLNLDLIYYPSIKYESIEPNKGFTLRESGKIVGFGKVLNVHFDKELK